MYSLADKFLLDERQELVDCLSNTGLSFDVNWWPLWHVTRATRATRVLLHALWSFARGRWPSDRSRVKSQLFMLGRAGRPVGTRLQEQGDARMIRALRSPVCTCGPNVQATCYELPLKWKWLVLSSNSSVKLYYICIFWHIALYVSAHTHVHIYVALLSILTPHQHVMTQFTGLKALDQGNTTLIAPLELNCFHSKQ